MKWLIRSLFITLLIVVFAAATLAALILSTDINRLKPVIKTQLEHQGISAEFSGDLGWSIYPSLSIQANNVSLKHLQNQQPLARIGKASFSVKLMPLLSREVDINEVLLANSELWYSPNTLTLLQEYPKGTFEPETSANSETESQQQFKLEAQQFDINQLTANVTGADGSKSQFGIDKFNATNINLEGDRFPVFVRASASLPQLPRIEEQLAASISLYLKKKELVIHELDSTTLFSHSGNTQAAEVNIESKIARVQWADGLTVNAPLTLSTPSVRNLLKSLDIELNTLSPNVLSSLNINAELQLSKTDFSLNKLKARIDETTLTGSGLVKLDPALPIPPVELQISADQLNLDSYLPPPSEEQQTPLESPPTPLPLELLRQLTATLSVDIGTLTIKDLKAKQLKLDVVANNGDIRLTRLNTNLLGGSINSQAKVNVGPDNLNLTGNLQSQSIDLHQTLLHFAQFGDIEGHANSEISFQSEGSTDQQLTTNLVAITEANIPTLKLSSFNLEQQYCEAVAWLEEKQGNTKLKQTLTEKQWNTFTQLKPVQLKAKLDQGKVNLNNLDADIEEIKASANGSFDIATGAFTFPIDLSLANFSNAPDSCGVIDKKWRELALPLICKGTMETIGAKTCLPDIKRINQLIEAKVNAKVDEAKDKAKAALDKKVEEEKQKLQDKADEKIKDALKDLKDDEKAKELEDKLKKLLGKGK